MQLSVKTEVMGKEANAPMKFSFSKTKPSNRRPPLPPRDRTAAAVATTDEIEYVTSLDAVRGLVSVNPRRGRSAKVVPKLENSWRPEKRMKNIMVEADVTKPTEETFDMETMAAGPKPDVQYGLTLMTTDDDVKVGFTSEGSEAASTSRRMSFKEVEDQKLREDMLTLPDSASLESYEDLPVEDFGEALLRGMGWEKGKPIGRNSKIVVAPIEYVKRAGRLGLGADPAPSKETSKKYIKPGETREKKPDLVAPPSTSGRSRNVIDSDTKLVERVRRGVAKGKVMSIILGRHAGLRGEVVDINTEAGDAGIQIVVKLVKSGEKVVLNEHELADVGSHEEESAMKKMGELRIGNGKSSGRTQERRSSRDLDREFDESKERSRSRNSEDSSRESGRREDERYSRKSHQDDEDHQERMERRDRREGSRSRRDGKRDSEQNERDDNGRKRDLARYNGEDDGQHREGVSSRRKEKNSRKREDDEMDVDEEIQRKHSRRKEESRNDRLHDNKHERHGDYSERDNYRNGKVVEGSSSTVQKTVSTRVSREVVLTTGNNKFVGETVTTSSRISESRRVDSGEEEGSSPSWLRSHIRVRFVSKSFMGGRLYLKKGRVIDVIRPKVCDILLDESGEILQEVRQDHLETALPKRGGRVIAVGGKYKGQIGKLLERDSENDVGVVQLEDDFEMSKFNLEDLAELVGDPNEDDD